MELYEILAIKMQENDAEASTIGDYLKKLLEAVWREGEGFSGKRPFGNSGWECEIYQALVAGGAVGGVITDDGLQSCDEAHANSIVFSLIDLVFSV